MALLYHLVIRFTNYNFWQFMPTILVAAGHGPQPWTPAGAVKGDLEMLVREG